jgi:hypothetical protein
MQPGNYMNAGIEPIFRGLANQVQGKVDAYMSDFFRGGMHKGPERAPWKPFRIEEGTIFCTRISH